MTTESKLGVCKYCSSPYHRGWQCPKKPKKAKNSSGGHQKTPVKRSQERNIIIKKLDSIYSRYSRMLQISEKNHCRCFICGKRLNFDDACIGHYISRRFISIRFEPMNANVICYKCNMIDKNQPEILQRYKERIIEEYGEEGYNKIIQKKSSKISTNDLENLLEEYKNKLKYLQNKN